MEPVRIHARRRSQPGGAMEWLHSIRRGNDPRRFWGPPSGTSSWVPPWCVIACMPKLEAQIQ
eukprot:7388231-Prymnesium_polylepis.2